MKKKNILYLALGFLGLTTSCSDYLEVESPSAFTDEYIFSSLDEANRLLNGVYTDLMASNLYGNLLMNTFNFNSDVEWVTNSNEIQSTSHNEFKAFDCESDASSLNSVWTAAYAVIESANNFVCAAEESDFYADRDTSLLQMIGEAKCMRAMTYLDMVILFGDIPFTFTRTYDAETLITPISDRDDILTALIEDLQEAAPYMNYAADINEGIERCSKEYAWALIARIALQRAGYSLHPGSTTSDYGYMSRPSDYTTYYQIARNYCDSVISAGTHSLSKDYYDVFIDECTYTVTNDDDPIFEIPFVQNVSGYVGYIHGPYGTDSSAGGTEAPNLWGTASASYRLNAFYRFTFDEEDARRDATIGYWYYTYAGVPTILNSYYNYCNKWSKFWDPNHTLGYQSSSNTGINYPYMRYADVLLMFAEAENELNNGPTDDAKAALKEVRERAFRYADDYSEMVDTYVDAATTKDEFFDLIVDERAWEFGGENMRWKDLIRWNLYAKTLYLTFWRYFGVGSDDYSYDFYDEYDSYPRDIYYKIVENPADGSYPNETLDILEFWVFEDEDNGYVLDNLWQNCGQMLLDGYAASNYPSTTGDDAWSTAQWMSWIDEDTGIANAQCRCSLRGYIYMDEETNFYMNGSISSLIYTSEDFNFDQLPVVRYILPIPDDAISRSNNTYVNYYGY